MSTRKSTIFYGVLIVIASLAVGMVIASRLDLAPESLARTINVPAANSAPLTGPIDATTFRNIAQQANPSVVSITTRMTRQRRGIGDLFDFDQPPQRRGQPERVQGAGSGFIIDTAGFILTNNHVIQDADSIEVQLASMRDGELLLPAKLIGRDPLTDIALIQLTETPKSGLVASKFGDSSQMAPGDWVMAIGNPFGLENTVTVGVVSAVGRPLVAIQTPSGSRQEEMIQTDAAINRGNSGGPLLNVRGEVVGINTMIISDESASNLGIGFAVPINKVRDLLPQLRKGKVTRGRIGISVQSTIWTRDLIEDLGLPGEGGALVGRTDEGGPADDAGMRPGDVIVEFAGKLVRNSNELIALVTATSPGTTVPVKVIRDRKAMTLTIKVEELDLEGERTGEVARGGGSPRSESHQSSFGMTLQPLTSSAARQLEVPAGRGGAIVASVDPGSPAALGLGPGDVILAVQGVGVKSLEEVTAALDKVPQGRTARLTVWRGGRENVVIVRKR